MSDVTHDGLGPHWRAEGEAEYARLLEAIDHMERELTAERLQGDPSDYYAMQHELTSACAALARLGEILGYAPLDHDMITDEMKHYAQRRKKERGGTL
jgi:hypothetical protein